MHTVDVHTQMPVVVPLAITLKQGASSQLQQPVAGKPFVRCADPEASEPVSVKVVREILPAGCIASWANRMWLHPMPSFWDCPCLRTGSLLKADG